MIPHEVVQGCRLCPHPDYCAGMATCEIGSPNERIKKGVLRAKAWLASGDPIALTPEIASALAEDVILFAGEIVRLRQERDEARSKRNELFADYVMSRLDP